MRIVIIEDEKITAEDLAATIISLEPDAQIIAKLRSVKNAIEYFKKNEALDLIFSDVQLGDGLSFEVFKAIKVTAPIVFCTAYDEYALNAFKTNSIDYVLKPFSGKEIAEALEKYKNIRQNFFREEAQYKTIIDTLINRSLPKTGSILVHYKDKIKPVRLDNIALFYIDNEITFLLTFDKEKYSINKGLEELNQYCGDNFFRVNRQCLLNRKIVIDVSQYFSRKLVVNIRVPFHEKITVSKEKTPLFLTWLQENE